VHDQSIVRVNVTANVVCLDVFGVAHRLDVVAGQSVPGTGRDMLSTVSCGLMHKRRAIAEECR